MYKKSHKIIIKSYKYKNPVNVPHLNNVRYMLRKTIYKLILSIYYVHCE